MTTDAITPSTWAETTDAITLLKESGALLEGHFRLSSGRHSDKYFQCARLLQHPDRAQRVLLPLARRIRQDAAAAALTVDAVVGPAVGGIVVAYELGRLLGVPAFFTERDDCGAMTLRRGFEVRPGANILIAEDVVTTGKSTLESTAVLEKLGASVCALPCVVDRRAPGAALLLPFPVYSTCRVDAGDWPAEDCPLCRQGVPVVKPGTRKVF